MRHHLLGAIIIALLSLCFLSFSIPQIYSFGVSDIFQYVNGWDEAVYLSFQGSKSARFDPTYFALNIIYGLHLLGISGAVQNLIFDTVVMPLVFLLLCAGLKKYCRAVEAAAYAGLIFFSGVFLSYVNPIIRHTYGLPRGAHFIMPGADAFISILRTPNPQFSIVLIITAVVVYLRIYKKDWILLLPCPFLYGFTLLPYASMLSILMLFNRGWIKGYKSLIAANAAVFILISIALSAFDMLYLRQTEVINTPQYFPGHNFYIPLSGLVSLLLYGALWGMTRLRKVPLTFRENAFFATTIFTMFVITNYQVISGFMLTYKNFQDYGNYFLFGILLSSWFYILGEKGLIPEGLRKVGLIAVLTAVFGLMLYGSGFNFNKMSYKIYIGNTLKDLKEIEKIEKSPMTSVVLNSLTSANIAYSRAKMEFPILSYAYVFSFIRTTVPCYRLYLKKLVEYQNLSESQQEIVSKYTQKMLKNKKVDMEHQGIDPRECPGLDQPIQKYEVVGTGNFRTFPNWKKILK